MMAWRASGVRPLCARAGAGADVTSMATSRSVVRGIASPFGGLRHDLRNRDAVDVGEPHVAAVEPIRQLVVVDAQQLSDRRVEIVIRYRLLFRLVAELVAGADPLAALDAGAGHPHRH